jgi:TolB-like protein/Tfp pilus assembly protein PilF
MWNSDTFVDYEQGINVAIKKVRSALGDSAEQPKYIQTIAKKGYKFLLPVEIIDPRMKNANAENVFDSSPIDYEPRLKEAHRTGWWILCTVAAAALVAAALFYVRDLRSGPSQIKSIAVLPLQNLSSDPEQDYFAEGMTDELITDLAKAQGLRVISRTSVMRYKKTTLPLPEIARELNVDAVVEGTMLRSANRVRLRVQLIDSRTDSHIWAEVYERNERDSFSLQNEVAHAIAQHINSEVVAQQDGSSSTVREPNFDAYSAYLKGRYEWNKRSTDSLRKSIQYFEDAIRIDPNYALAHEGLAEAYTVLTDYDVLTPKESYTRAKSEALKALQLDDGLGQAHATLASVKEELDWDWEGADPEFRRAIELSPSYATARQWYSEYLLRVGRLDEGVAEMKQAQQLDPGSPLMNAELGGAYYWARRNDAAIDQLRKAITMEPGFAYAHSWLGFAYEQKGMRDKAIEEFQKAVSLSGGSTGFIAALGHAYGLVGNKRETEDILEKLKALSKRSYVSPYDIAIVYTSVGDKDQALRWLEIGYSVHDPAMDMLKMEPALDGLRPDPQFQDLIHRVGLPAT